ncbi:MAG: hypothetical protein QXJ77_01915 [Candidatus Bathyarchaeia archaeon]
MSLQLRRDAYIESLEDFLSYARQKPEMRNLSWKLAVHPFTRTTMLMEM